MQKSESIVNITKAIIAVMTAVKGIDKNMTVGSGSSAYKGVSDHEVKKEIGRAMEKNGLAIVPTEVAPKLQIDRWQQEEFYNGKSNGMKQKQAVFAEVSTKYLLLHESGEWMELAGYGHGADTQDKAAGKATTYALKYTLLYTFMVPTGKIDDADATHSDDMEAPQAKPATSEKPWLNENTDAFTKAKEFVQGGGAIAKIEAKYRLSKAVKEKLTAA